MYTAFRVVSVFSQSLLLLDGCKFIFARPVRAFFCLYLSTVRQGSVEILQKVVGVGDCNFGISLDFDAFDKNGDYRRGIVFI